MRWLDSTILHLHLSHLRINVSSSLSPQKMDLGTTLGTRTERNTQILTMAATPKGLTGPNNLNATTGRYKIIISDGLNFLQAMLATQLNYLVEEDRIGKDTIALVEKMS